MKKGLVIIISVQSILASSSLIYAIVQREEAIRQREIAEELYQMAQEQRMIAAKSRHDLEELKQEMLKVSSPCP